MIISLDTEYTDLNIKKAELLSISIGTETAEYIFKPHELHKVKDLVDKSKCIFVQNGTVDWYILNKSGLILDRSKFIDTMLMHHLIDENSEHSLGAMAVHYFNDSYKKEFWNKYETFQDAPKHEALEYEKKDARYTYDLGVKFLERLKNKLDLITHIHKLNWALFDIETEGIHVDTQLIKSTKEYTENKINGMLPKLREEFYEYCEVWEMQKWAKEIEKRKSPKGKAGVDRPVFSFASDKQLGELLYSECYLGFKAKTKTKKGSPSTDYDSLKELAEKYPKVQSIFDYKQEKSLYATFMKGMLERVIDNKVYPHFNVNGTTTGRLSSSNPNFQNMPQEGVIRNFILPDPGCLIVGADFESLEVGIELNLTEDKALLSIMRDGKSKHDITAEAVGMTRKDAKTLNFLCQYGGGIWKIQKTFKVTEKEAQEIYDKYWIAYSGVMDYKKRVFKELEDTGQVINCFGRIRHFPKPRDKWEKARFERQAYSHMVQGPGAEMTNIATYKIAEELKHKDIGRLLYPVHDEIVCSAKKEFTEQIKNVIVKIMQNTNDVLGFKHRIKAKAYGDFQCWKKA